MLEPGPVAYTDLGLFDEINALKVLRTTPPLFKGRLGGVAQGNMQKRNTSRTASQPSKHEYKYLVKSIVYIYLILLGILYLFDLIYIYCIINALNPVPCAKHPIRASGEH